MVGVGSDSDNNYAFGVNKKSDIISGNENLISQDSVNANENDKSTYM